jgi:hypothetical protein
VKATRRDAIPAFHGTAGGLKPFHTAMVSAFVMVCIASVFCQEQFQTPLADLQKEAASWQQKIKALQERIAKTDADAADAVRSFRAYLRTEAAHKAEFQAQDDSLSLDIAAAKKRVDSLERSAGIRKLDVANSDNRVEEMRLALLAACGDLKNFYTSLPPSSVQATVTTLDFLKSELESKTVTVSEAIERYWQILGVLDDAETSMDTYAAASPVPGQAGGVYFVRIGLAYCAVVTEEGKSAYLWVPGNAGDGAWQPVTDLMAKSALWDAVRVRDRKIVPRIVDLPFNHPLDVRGVEETGKVKRGQQP